MDLTKIILNSVSDKRFEKLALFWYNQNRSKGKHNPVEIKNTLKYTSYQKLLEEFFKHPFADRIYVRSPTRRLKDYTRRLNSSDIELALEIIAEVPLKINYLELYFKPNKRSKLNAKLKFMEAEGQIFTYQINFSPALSKYFSWETKAHTKNRWSDALFLPPNLELKTKLNKPYKEILEETKGNLFKGNAPQTTYGEK